jgi:hypothetical protein
MRSFFNGILVLLWFAGQRLVEVAILASTIGSFYVYRTYLLPLVPPETALWYVVFYAETVFAFAIVLQITVIVWISRAPPFHIHGPPTAGSIPA